jgi:hypothetical protein
LEAISKMASPKFIYILVETWDHYYFKKRVLWENLNALENKIILTFDFFNRLMKTLVFYQYFSNVNDISDHRKIIESVASILEKVGHFDLTIDVNFYELTKFSITTRGYVKFLNNLYKILLEPNSLKGLEKAFYRLKLLSQNYNGIIPDDITEKANIFSLVIACNYFSCSINRNKLRSLDLKAMEPKMLAFLLHFALGIDNHLETIFLECASDILIDGVIKKLKNCFRGELEKYGYESRMYPENLLPSISRKLSGRKLELFRIYAKLLSYSRSISDSKVNNLN